MLAILLNFIGLWIFLLIGGPHAVVDGKHLAFFFTDFAFKFDEKFMNLSTDLSIYKTNTKKHPVHLVPEVKIEIFEDIPRLHIQLLAKDLRNQKTMANRTIDLCDVDDFFHSNVFLKSLLHHLFENLKFALKCPFKKGTYVIKEHAMPNYVVPGFFQLKDKFINTQKVKTRINNHIRTIFESSYVTEVCEFD